MKQLDSITNSMDMNLSTFRETGKGQGNLACCSSWGCKRVRHDLETEQQQKLLFDKQRD